MPAGVALICLSAESNALASIFNLSEFDDIPKLHGIPGAS